MKKYKFLGFVLLSLSAFRLEAAPIKPVILEGLKSKSVYAIQYVSPADDESLVSLRDNFLNTLKSEHVFMQYQVLDYVYLSDDIGYLKGGFREGYVFDFKKKSSGIRIRLIDFSNSDIVWVGECEESKLSSCVNDLLRDFESSHPAIPSPSELPPPPVVNPPANAEPISTIHEPDLIFPEQGVYIDAGIGYALLMKGDDRSVLKDSIWISGRGGYQFSRNFGFHLEMGDSPIHAKSTTSVKANYFYIAPGIKYTAPIQEHLAVYLAGSMGYGHLKVTSTSSSANASGLHLGMEFGMTYKFNSLVGVSPYLALPSISDAHSSSPWFVFGVLTNVTF